MNTLDWHKARAHPTEPGTLWRAWAPALMPDATMPPYYEIEVACNAVHRSARRVFLVQCKTCGGNRQQICGEINLAVAKDSAQADYDKRIEQQTLTSPPKSA